MIGERSVNGVFGGPTVSVRSRGLSDLYPVATEGCQSQASMRPIPHHRAAGGRPLQLGSVSKANVKTQQSM